MLTTAKVETKEMLLVSVKNKGAMNVSGEKFALDLLSTYYKIYSLHSFKQH